MRISAQECFLREILGFFSIAGEIEGDSKRFLLMALHKFLERALIALLRQGNEFFISRLQRRALIHAEDYSTCEGREMTAATFRRGGYGLNQGS